MDKIKNIITLIAIILISLLVAFYAGRSSVKCPEQQIVRIDSLYSPDTLKARVDTITVVDTIYVEKFDNVEIDTLECIPIEIGPQKSPNDSLKKKIVEKKIVYSTIYKGIEYNQLLIQFYPDREEFVVTRLKTHAVIPGKIKVIPKLPFISGSIGAYGIKFSDDMFVIDITANVFFNKISTKIGIGTVFLTSGKIGFGLTWRF